MEDLKKQAAMAAVDYVKSGMKLGLGTGTTVKYAIEEIGRLLKTGELTDISAVPSSESTRFLALESGIPLTELDGNVPLDLYIDGADEVDFSLNLIKGGGGALTREKILSASSEYSIIVVDESKISESLGDKWSVPVEVMPFGAGLVKSFITEMGFTFTQRQNKMNNSAFITDNGNYIFDVKTGPIENPGELDSYLNYCPGIIEHGIFPDMTDLLIIGTEEGVKQIVPEQEDLQEE